MGMTITIVTSVCRTIRNVLNVDRHLSGRIASDTKTSLLNRLMIRPLGLVSKKDMGNLINAPKIRLCSLFADFSPPNIHMRYPKNWNSAVEVNQELNSNLYECVSL